MQQKSDSESAFENILRTVNESPQKELEVRFHGRFMNLQLSNSNHPNNSDDIFRSNIQPRYLLRTDLLGLRVVAYTYVNYYFFVTMGWK
jgi:hypothetical protein